jgi:hypothetical protein
MLASAWLPSPDRSVFPVALTMDWHILLFPLYVACLFGILFLLLLVARKHSTPGKRTNFAETRAWQFHTQETSSLLAWVRGLCAVDKIQPTDRL